MAKRSFGQGLKKWNPSQIVAHNMTKAREFRGKTQTEVAEELSRFTETKWTKTSVAQAEGSVSGARIRAFTAVELVALARTFDLPVTYFLAPPEDRDNLFLDLPGVPIDAWEYLVMLTVGHEDNAEILGGQYAWAWSTLTVDPPRADLGPDEINDFTAGVRSKMRLNPSDVLGAAFHGLMLERATYTIPTGKEIDTWIDVLDSLRNALLVFKGYKPGRFVDPKIAQEIVMNREKSAKWDREAEEDRDHLGYLRHAEKLEMERQERLTEGGENEQKDE